MLKYRNIKTNKQKIGARNFSFGRFDPTGKQEESHWFVASGGKQVGDLEPEKKAKQPKWRE